MPEKNQLAILLLLGLGTTAVVLVLGLGLLYFIFSLAPQPESAIASNETVSAEHVSSERAAPPASSEANKTESLQTPTEEQPDWLNETPNSEVASEQKIPREAIPIVGANDSKEAQPASTSIPSDARKALATPKSAIPVTIDLPFAVAGIKTSTTADRCVAWGYYLKPPAGPPPSDRKSSSETHIALVDLKTQQFKTTTLNAKVQQAVLNPSGIYATRLSSSNSDKIELIRLSPQDLSVTHRELFEAGNLVSVDGKFLRIEKENQWKPTQVLRVPDLNVIGTIDNKRVNNLLHDRNAPTRRVLDGWHIDNVLWDKELSHPQMILNSTKFNYIGGFRGIRNRNEIESVLTLLGPHIDLPTKMNEALGWEPTKVRFSPFFSAMYRFNDDSNPVTLDFCHPISFEVLKSISFPKGWYLDHEVSAESSPNWIVLASREELIVTPVPDEQRDVEFFRFDPIQSQFTIDPWKKNTLTYHAKGATRYELELPGLLPNQKSIRLESEDGEFLIDIEEPVAKLLESYIPAMDRSSRFGPIKKWTDEYMSRAESTFTRILKRKPNGVPFAMQANVRAYGSDLSTAVMRHDYLLEIPFEKISQIAQNAKQANAVANKQNERTSDQANSRSESDNKSVAPRQWTDKKGMKITATFIGFGSGEEDIRVRLKTSSGREVSLRLDDLSKQDQDWISQRANRNQ